MNIALYGEVISTHALTEGDEVDLYARRCRSISTHALTEGDMDEEEDEDESEYFNSRPHGGRRMEDAEEIH